LATIAVAAAVGQEESSPDFFFVAGTPGCSRTRERRKRKK
jgi:hypothetical protein